MIFRSRYVREACGGRRIYHLPIYQWSGVGDGAGDPAVLKPCTRPRRSLFCLGVFDSPKTVPLNVARDSGVFLIRLPKYLPTDLSTFANCCLTIFLGSTPPPICYDRCRCKTLSMP